MFGSGGKTNERQAANVLRFTTGIILFNAASVKILPPGAPEMTLKTTGCHRKQKACLRVGIEGGIVLCCNNLLFCVSCFFNAACDS